MTFKFSLCAANFTDLKFGFSSSLLPAEAVEKLTTEQELEEIIESF